MKKWIFVFPVLAWACQSPKPQSHSGTDTAQSVAASKTAPANPEFEPVKKLPPLSQTLHFKQVSFEVNSPNNGPQNYITIRPQGMKDGSVVRNPTGGNVQEIFTADLNGDGYPEIYYTVIDRTNQVSLKGYASDHNKSLAMVFMSGIETDTTYGTGHRGGDQFKLANGQLLRTFPVYKGSDPDTSPSGGTRTVIYKLVSGANGWVLRPAGIKKSK